jgi:hypothetical protein
MSHVSAHPFISVTVSIELDVVDAEVEAAWFVGVPPGL